MNYTQEKIDKLHATYIRRYRSVMALQGAKDNMTEPLKKEEFFKRYLEEKEKKGMTMNVIQTIVYSQIKKY